MSDDTSITIKGHTIEVGRRYELPALGVVRIDALMGRMALFSPESAPAMTDVIPMAELVDDGVYLETEVQR